MDPLQALQAAGLELPSPLYLVGAIVFGLVGWFALRAGRRLQRPMTLWLGVALMVYPYLVSNTGLLFAVGAALSIGLLLDRRRHQV